MAGPRIRHSPYRNPPPDGEDELAGSPPRVFTKGSNTPTLFPSVSRAQTSTSTRAPVPPSNERLFQQFIKAYLENYNQN